MKNSKLNIAYSIYVVLTVLIAIGLLTESLTFGIGLGDLGMLMIMLISTIIFGLLVLIKKKGQELTGKWNLIIFTMIILFFIYFVLALSIWRGIEKPWDGKIFSESSENTLSTVSLLSANLMHE